MGPSKVRSLNLSWLRIFAQRRRVNPVSQGELNWVGAESAPRECATELEGWSCNTRRFQDLKNQTDEWYHVVPTLGIFDCKKHTTFSGLSLLRSVALARLRPRECPTKVRGPRLSYQSRPAHFRLLFLGSRCPFF